VGIDVRRLALAAAFTVVSSPVWSTVALATPVTLNAVNEPGGAVLNEPVQWQVLRIDNKGSVVPTPVATGSDAVLKTDLPAGHYMLKAQRGTIAIQQGLVIGSGSETRNIVVSSANAAVKASPDAAKAAAPAAVATGAPATVSVKPADAKPAQAAAAPAPVLPANSKLLIGMIPSSGRSAITDPIKWQVFTYTKGVTENGHLVAEKTVPSAMFKLPAGSYVVRAAYKGTQVDLVIPLAANQSYNYTINLYAGQAKLTAVKPTGPAREALVWQVVREKPGPDGKYELVASSSDASPNLLLREGKYLVVGRLGDLWGMQPLTVTAGRTASARVKLQRGDGAPVVVASAN
jgi:hypothetical protein